MSEAVIFPDLKGKKILITGALRGIGKAIAFDLAKQGASIVFNYRGDEARAHALADELLQTGASQVRPLPFDLTDSETMQTVISAYVKEEGPITGLVNNAGISQDQIVLRLKAPDVKNTIETNLVGPILLTAALSRSFLKAENVSIVNVSSIVGLMGNPSQIAYAASKAGLIGFTKSLAKELASRNVRCNSICPGFIGTDMTDQLNPKVKEEYLGHIPLQRFGQASEVAQLVCFLLSQSSSYITGETIKIDGGLYI